MAYIDTTTIVFILALASIIGMIELKYLEIKKSRKLFLSRLGESTDHVVHGAYNKARYFFSHFNRRTFIALTQWVAAHILTWVRTLYIDVYDLAHKYPHSKKVIDMVRGRGEANSNGGSSFYIKQIVQEASQDIPADAAKVAEDAPIVAPVIPAQGVAKEAQK